MKKEYCILCGEANLFEVNKPKFCCGCGETFNNTSPQKSQAKSYTEDDDDEINVDFDINKLKKDIKVEMDLHRVTAESLFANPLDPSKKENFNRKYSGPEGKDLLKEIAKQCGTSREFKE